MTMPLPRVRQLVLAALELKEAEDTLCSVLEVEVGFRDDLSGFGLENIVIPIGDTFLEVVSPITNPPEKSAAGRHIARCGGDCGYMVIIQVLDFGATFNLIEAHSLRRVWDIDRENHGVHAQAAHLHPLDVPGAILSLDQMTPTDGWQWGGPHWREKVAEDGPSVELCGATFTSTDPARLAQMWNKPLGLEVKDNHGDAVITLGQTHLRFSVATKAGAVPHRLDSFQLRVRDEDAGQGILKRAKTRGLDVEKKAFTTHGVRFELIA